MAQVGLKHTYLALIDANGKILKGDDGLTADGLYTSNSKDLGTASAKSRTSARTERKSSVTTEWLTLPRLRASHK